MRSDELIASGDLAADGFSAFTRQIRSFHAGIAERVWGSLGDDGAATPARVIHDGIADAVYRAVGTAGSVAVRAGARAGALLAEPDAESIERDPRARFAIGAVNGAFGDALQARGNGLTITMGVTVRGAAVPPERAALSSAFPQATGQVAVFLHGLCETEDVWNRRRREIGSSYGSRLRAELGYTPVYVRYNSGRHISHNGRTFSALLTDLHREWPVPLTEIAVIGHSMGGLIARSACHYGAGSEATAAVRHVVSLGAPHTGSWLERVAHAARASLRRLPETRALGDALGARSAGVRDLFHGYLVDEDWEQYDPDALVCALGTEIPFLDCANHYFVAATLTRDPASPVANVIGDMLVSRPSAWGEHRTGERLRFDLDNYRSLGPANHFDLLNHPAIGDQLVAWLGGSEPAISDRSGRGPARVALAERSAAAAKGLPARIRSRRRWS